LPQACIRQPSKRDKVPQAGKRVKDTPTPFVRNSKKKKKKIAKLTNNSMCAENLV
jgi:hypothetical protein